MVKASGFVQRAPHDGQPASQPTEAYLGYDEKNLYAVFVCFDEPGKVRARMSRRTGSARAVKVDMTLYSHVGIFLSRNIMNLPIADSK